MCSSKTEDSPPLNSLHCAPKSCIYSKEKCDSTIEEWKQVAWSDEPRFRLHHVDGRLRIICQPHEAMDLASKVGTVQSHGTSIIWRGGGLPCQFWRLWYFYQASWLHISRYISLAIPYINSCLPTPPPNGNGVYWQNKLFLHRSLFTCTSFEKYLFDLSLLKLDIYRLIFPPCTVKLTVGLRAYIYKAVQLFFNFDRLCPGGDIQRIRTYLLQHQPVYTGQDPHFKVPVLRVTWRCSEESVRGWQDRTWLPRSGAARFISGILLARLVYISNVSKFHKFEQLLKEKC